MESEQTGEEKSYRELGHLFDCLVEVLATVGTDLVQVARLQVVGQTHQDHAGEHEETPDEVDDSAADDCQGLDLLPLGPVTQQVEQEARPEQEGGGDHDVALPLLGLIVQLEHVVQGAALVRPGQVSPRQMEDFLYFFLRGEALC